MQILCTVSMFWDKKKGKGSIDEVVNKLILVAFKFRPFLHRSSSIKDYEYLWRETIIYVDNGGSAPQPLWMHPPKKLLVQESNHWDHLPSSPHYLFALEWAQTSSLNWSLLLSSLLRTWVRVILERTATLYVQTIESDIEQLQPRDCTERFV